MTGKAMRGNTVSYGEIGLMAMGNRLGLPNRQIESSAYCHDPLYKAGR